MLNGDDILELADETGYRLCNFALPDAIPSEQKVFSVTWDQNNHHRLFICLQDGQLKSVDVKTHESKDYHVRFRRFLANEETMTNNDEKIIQHHWDKMTTIPGRPDELIFLLGFSKTVVYTALPKSVDASEENSPVISAYSRDDLPGYIYGVPIMQITQHTGRITALDINQNHGNILASGDEYGSVRLLLLQHIDKSHFFTQPLLGTSQPNQTNQILAKYPFLPSYNVSFQAHEGSIFSLAWFPLHGKTLENGVTTFGLVTGSTDRVVKIWQISFNNTQGFHIEPCLQLNTLSTQILCLNAFSPISSDEHNHCVYISAGTNLGTVHIWKLSSDETYDILHPNPLANEIQNISNDFEFQSSHKQHIDTGNYLIALIQASDKPIMHIQCTLSTSKFRKRNSTHGELLLSFFDTGSCLYLYSSEIYTNDPTNNNNNNLENEFSLEDNVQLEGIRNKYMKSIQLNNVDRLLYSMDYTEKETFVPIKDETFLESQIVASGFSYASEGELMVCTMNGQLQFFNDFNTPTPTNTPQKLMKSPLREPMHSSIKVDSLKTFLNLEDEQEDEDIDPRNNNNSRLQLTIPADSPISPLKKNSTNEQTLNKTPTTNNNIKTPTNFSAKNQVNQSDELEPKPRMTTPQPTPTKSPSSNTSKRFLQPTLSHSMKQETSSSKQQQQTSTMISKKNLSSLNTIQTSSTNRAKANDDDQRSVSNESYTSVSSNATGATNINYMAKLKEFQSYREDLEPSPYINNPLAEPTLHTVKVLEDKLHNMIDYVENDEVSVTTIQTTPSMQVEAAKTITNVRGNRFNSSTLPQAQYLDAQEMEIIANKLKPSKPMTTMTSTKGKYTSSTNSIHSTTSSSTNKAREVFEIPEPYVDFQFYHSENTNNSSNNPNNTPNNTPMTSRYRYNRASGLHASIDPIDHWPKYHYEINFQDKFPMNNTISRLQQLRDMNIWTQEDSYNQRYEFTYYSI